MSLDELIPCLGTNIKGVGIVISAPFLLITHHSSLPLFLVPFRMLTEPVIKFLFSWLPPKVLVQKLV